MHTILIAEDEPEVRNYLRLALTCQGYYVEFAQNGEEVIRYLSDPGSAPASLLLLDIAMPCKDGWETLREVRAIFPDMPVIMLSGASSPANIVLAMKNGARDFIPKPVSHEDLREAIKNALPSIAPRLAPPRSWQEDAMEGCEPPSGAWSKKIELLIQVVGSSDVPALLLGETGVGKEVLARKLHSHSPRASKPFLKLNCAAFPSELVESELFGYERGSFTGAIKNTPGKFEMANGGTILLDEIGDMDFKLQAKLLQVLQDGEFLRIGARETTKVDVRIMAATHCDLEIAIVENRFREDLYYRLNIIDVRIPPLRDRLDEVIPLAEFFLKKYAMPALPLPDLSPSLKRALLDHDWPGNIRELENVMRKFLVLRDPQLLADELYRRPKKRSIAISPRTATLADKEEELMVLSPDLPAFAPQPVEPASAPVPVSILDKVESVKKAAEVDAILRALNSTLWNRKQAATLLKLDYKALLYKMKKLGIGTRPNEFGQGDDQGIAAQELSA